MIANLASAVSSLKHPVQERDRRWDMEDTAEEVLHHLEKAKKKKEALKRKTPDSGISEDKGCHSSGCDERGRGPKAPDSPVWFKDGRIRANTGNPNAGEYPYSSCSDEYGRGLSNGSPVWYRSGGTRGRTGSPSSTPGPSRRVRRGETMPPRGPRGVRY
ncbi:hypothetical protein FRC04_006516 [Tulasnella sp. 424]|nr:hypothetical protein FRC04_006516 [Tulasnella sp. 424]KAG8981025.1 hypothetical protein FRC05_003925 [Tulasnella sp. 425]